MRLIIVTATLVALGIILYKKTHQKPNNDEALVVIQHGLQKASTTRQDNNQSTSNSCAHVNSQCNSSTNCCKGSMCDNGICQ